MKETSQKTYYRDISLFKNLISLAQSMRTWSKISTFLCSKLPHHWKYIVFTNTNHSFYLIHEESAQVFLIPINVSPLTRKWCTSNCSDFICWNILCISHIPTYVRSWLVICWLSVAPTESLTYFFYSIHDAVHRVAYTRPRAGSKERETSIAYYRNTKKPIDRIHFTKLFSWQPMSYPLMHFTLETAHIQKGLQANQK